MPIFFLIILLFSFPCWVHSQELSLYVVPSAHGTDWSTPRSLFISAVRNHLSFAARAGGHVMVELACPEKTQLLSMAAQQTDYLRQLLLRGNGLGVLYQTFPGKLEEQEQLAAELKDLSRSGRLSFIRFKLNAGICQRLTQYVKEFRQHQVARNYGLPHRPLYGEGANGASFSVSFLHLAGILEQDYVQQWTKVVNIPLKLAGAPLSDESINILKLFTAQWADQREASQSLQVWDADLMHQWINKQLSQRPSAKLGLLKMENSQGIWLDKSHFPVPPEAIWRQDVRAP